jgi:hypothetical protein
VNRRRFIIPLIWLGALVFTAAWAIVTPLLPPPTPAGHTTVFMVYSPSRAGALLAPLGVFTAAAWIIDAWLQLAYRRWLAWAQLGLILSGAVAIYLIPAIVFRIVLAGAPAGRLMAAFRVLNLIGSAGYFLALAGLFAFCAMLISIVIRLWTRPRPS